MARIKSLDPKAIAELYEAATDEVAWRQFGDKLAQHLGVNTAGLWITENGVISEMLPSANHSETIEPYTAHFAKLDPWAGRMRFIRGQVTLGSEIFDERDLVNTEFYNDFAKNFGHMRPMGLNLIIEPGVIATIALENRYTNNLFEASDKLALEAAMEHLRRIIQLRRLWAKQRMQVDLMRTSLDAIGFGLITCQADGRVAIMNYAAEEMSKHLGNIRFSGTSPLSGSRSRDETRRLAAFIHDAAHGGVGGVMPLAGIEGQPVVTALVSPVSRNLAPGPSHALVALQPVSGAGFMTEQTIAASFGLTPAQASVAHALLNGSSVEGIVAQRGVKMSTVRSQLAAIYARTGTASQRDLIRMLSTLPAIRL